MEYEQNASLVSAEIRLQPLPYSEPTLPGLS